MSNDQQFLSPDQQDSIFQKLKDAGLLSSDAGQSTTAPDDQAKSGVGNVDLATLQSLIKHAVNPDAVPMQEGDKLHPMDAIQQIGSKMFGPEKPSGVELTGGPQISKTPQGTLTANVPSSNLLLRKLGVSVNQPVSNANYYPALKAQGLDKYLPSGLAQMPDGTPYVDSATDAQARNNAHLDVIKQLANLAHPETAQDVASAIAKGDQDAVNKAWNSEHPGEEVPLSIVAATTAARNALANASRTNTNASNAADNRLSKAQSAYNSDKKKEQDALDAVTTARGQIQASATNPVAWSSTPITLARMLTGTSRINVQEIQRLGGTQAIVGKLGQIATTMANGTITPENLQYMNNLADILEQAHTANIANTATRHANQWARISKKALPDAYKDITGTEMPALTPTTPVGGSIKSASDYLAKFKK